MLPPIHVRTLINQLNYPQLVRSQIIPDLEKFTPALSTKRYPPFIYQLNKAGHTSIFAELGLFIERIIYQSLSSDKVDFSQIWSEVSELSMPPELRSNFVKSIINTFKPVLASFAVQHEPEFVHHQVQGHPDFFGLRDRDQSWLLDVKTTGNFTKMAHQSFLQILTYCALIRSTGQANNYIGILLPLQKQIIWYDVSNWNSSAFWRLVTREAKWCLDDQLRQLYPMGDWENLDGVVGVAPDIFGSISRTIMSDIVGSHVFKDNIDDRRVPQQVFITNPRKKEVYLTDDNIREFKEKLFPHTIMYIHAPYTINLCSDKSWSRNRLIQEIKAGRELNSRGVVVHVGKHKEKSLTEGLDLMEKSIRECLPYAEELCPLIIETPVGQGTELCADITEFLRFYSRFTAEERKKLKICIDTAHIFVSSYDPEYYLTKWLIKYPESVALIHYNDSENPRGCRVDGHAVAGTGHIGYKRMWKIHELARANCIPMVRE